MKLHLYCSFSLLIVIAALHSTNNPLEKKIVTFTKRKLIFTKNVNDEVDEEVLKMCSAECVKLSKIFGCFCDPDCGKFNDCCNIKIYKCENYFEEMKKGQQYGKKKSLKGKSDNNNNNKNNNKNDSNAPAPTIAVRGGSCCSDSQPTDCFCDSKCNLFGDCCEDYQKCQNKSDLNMKARLIVKFNKNSTYNKVEVRNTTLLADSKEDPKIKPSNNTKQETQNNTISVRKT